MAWLTGWNRRKPKIINGSTAGIQANYQMQLTVHKGSGADTTTDIYLGTNVRNDFGDIRFTNADGSTLLNYWIESYTSGISAIVWIQIDSIPVSPGNVTIYIYYDNPLVISASNGTATFEFFDDFENYNIGNLNGQGNWSGSTVFNVQNNLVYTGSKAVSAVAGTAGSIAKTFSPIVTGTFRGYIRGTSTSLVLDYDWFEDSTPILAVQFDLTAQILDKQGASWVNVGSWLANEWYMVEYTLLNSTQHKLKIVKISNGSIIVNTGTVTNANTYTNGINKVYYGGHIEFGSGTHYFDTFSVRKYVSPEPTWSCSGGEEVYTISWLSGWNRRKSKIINGSTPSQTNYQMKLTVHKATDIDTTTDIYLGTNVRNDFGDVRFTKPDGSSLLNYWIESISGTTAIVWIQIDSIQANPCTSTIYIYYDNPSAASTSNGTNTFEFFDDFLGSSLGPAWTAVSGVSVTNSILTLSSATGGQAYTGLIFNPGIVMRTKEKRYGTVGSGNRNTDSAFHDSTYRNSYDAPNVVTAGTDYNSGKGHIAVSKKAGSTYGSSYNSSLVDNGANWHNVELTWSNNLVKFMWDNTVIGSTTDTSKIPVVSQRLQFDIYTNQLDVDWVTVSKYTSPEPTFGLSSAEELNITTIAMTLNTNSCLGPCSITANVTWQNLSTSSITFRPAILVDGITIVPADADITIAAGVTGFSLITTPTLSVGTHSICPYPN